MVAKIKMPWKSGLVAQASNLSTPEAEAGELGV